MILGGIYVNRNDFIGSIDLSTRRKRRAATKLAAHLVGLIHLEESNYMERIPLNLQDSAVYDAADEAVDWLAEALSALDYAYDD